MKRKKTIMHVSLSFIKFLLIGISFLYITTCFASSENIPKVNILTWWGYLSDPWVHQMIRDKCHVNVAYDEYYTNDDFMRRFHEYKEFYDIAIFPSMDYEALKNEMKDINSSIYKHAEHYEKNIKLNYIKNNYEHNISYFMISYSLFLYNPKTINLSENDTINEIFEKAKSKIVVLSDEPIYLHYLLNLPLNENNLTNAFSRFTKLTNKSKLFITNTISPAYNDPNFSFAFTWTGIALYALNNDYKDYKFLLHPKFSLVSADLLAALNKKSNTQCVANVMSSKTFLSKMQNDALYFSPYGDSEQITNKILKNAHEKFFTHLSNLKWYTPISAKKYNALNRAWSYHFRLNLDKSINE